MRFANSVGAPIASDPWALLDGRANAPTGAANYPNLLDGYAARPPWQVAGVDYRVGINTGITLKNPETDTLPTNCTRNTTTDQMFVNGSTTVDGWDFTGWDLLVTAGTNVVVQNCLFAGGGFLKWIAHAPADSGTATGAIIRYCEFDNQEGSDFHFQIFTPGTTIIEYNWMKRPGAVGSQYSLAGGGEDVNKQDITFRFNASSDHGAGFNENPGIHADYTQILCDCTNVRYEFNTMFQTLLDAQAHTQGFSSEDADMDITNSLICSHNVMLAPNGTNTNHFVLFGIERITNSVELKNNYMDLTEANFYQQHDDQPGPQNPTKTVTGNINMVTGAAHNP